MYIQDEDTRTVFPSCGLDNARLHELGMEIVSHIPASRIHCWPLVDQSNGSSSEPITSSVRANFSFLDVPERLKTTRTSLHTEDTRKVFALGEYTRERPGQPLS